MLNIIDPMFLVIEPFVFYFPSPSSCFYHFLQIFLCQFYVCMPLEFMCYSLSIFLCFIPVTVYIGFLFLSGCLLYMVDVFSVPGFLPYPFHGLCAASTGNPFIALCQCFLTGCFLRQYVFPPIATA